jgi:transcriptional regulator with XRE-family HTH domain
MHPDLVFLTLQARNALGLGQKGLGDLLGASRRTVQRWDSRQGAPSADQLARLATAVHPHNAPLATNIAALAGMTLEQLGLVRPEPVAAPPAVTDAPALRPPSPPPHLTATVVCAAAEALNASPLAVRPVLLAAFRRAREVGLRVEDVEGALSEAIEKGRPKASRRRE